MRIDRTHQRWATASAVVLGAALAIYVPYAWRPVPPSGGSGVGLGYGIAGFAAMAFVTLLSVRKKFPIWRIGRTQSWMRGHLWLGALTLPLIFLHGGFRMGHGLTAVTMWSFVLVYVSGLAGAALQHVVPARMTREVPLETIYDEVGHVRAQLLDEADSLVTDASGKLEVAVPIGAPLREFYAGDLRPFFERPSRSHPFADVAVAGARFSKLRAMVPASLHAAVTDLESICEEQRQLLRQERLHALLHGWLIVHVPLSFALMALAVVHIVMALRF